MEYVEVVYWQDVEELVKNGAYLLDMCTKEVERGMATGAHHIPLDDLRENLDKLPRDKEFIAYCQVSLRSYIANRIL